MSFPLGAILTPDGVNFALYSKNATEVFLLLFDKPDGEPTDIIQLRNRDKFSKYNEQNGENNQDGANDNNSWNCGVEGDTDNPAILTLRKQLMKNYVCYLLFASGTPMILGGDEFARSQRGNNNAYCQDNDMSWSDWTAVSRNDDLFEFFHKAIAFTRRFPILQNRKFFLGKDLDVDQVPDLIWFAPDLGRSQWDDASLRTLCYQLDASEDGADLGVERLCFILNSHFDPQWVKLPPLESGRVWHRAIDTSLPGGEDFTEPGREISIDPADHYIANPPSTVVLLAQRPGFARRSGVIELSEQHGVDPA
jgi:isoamylase